MAGGPGTPRLAAAVSGAGGLGFLAAGYKSAAAVRAEIRDTRALTDRPFGVNVFVPTPRAADPETYAAYVDRLQAEARRYGVALGEPRFDDDEWEAKLSLLEQDPVAVVGFTFGCPPVEVVDRLKDAGSSVWVTVTETEEAEAAATAGADALVVQGIEAGAHRGSFEDRHDAPDYALLPLLQVIGRAVEAPMIASGGIATGRAVAAVLCAGAQAAQLGTAFLRCPEAGTSATHREALSSPAPTRLTRAFTGRLARGLVNRFLEEHGEVAPIAYPEIHHVTAPLRAAARQAGDPGALNLWAGQAHPLAQTVSAADVVRSLTAEAATTLRDAERALSQRGGPQAQPR